MMPGMRGLRRCDCDTNMVFGWEAKPFPDLDGDSGPVPCPGLMDMRLRKVPAVNAPYMNARGDTSAGSIPVPGNWSLSLSDRDSQREIPLNTFTDIIWARVVYGLKGEKHVICCTGISLDQPSSDTGFPEGNNPQVWYAVSANLDDDDPAAHLIGGELPVYQRSVTFIQVYGGATTLTPGYLDPRVFGFSKETIVQIDNSRWHDGFGYVLRYNLRTGSWGAGFAESATTSSGKYIHMPAQMAEDGKPWVLAKDYQSIPPSLHTGVWTNKLCNNEDNPMALIGSPPFSSAPTLPAVLTNAEIVNHINIQQVANYITANQGGANVLDVVAKAYTRREGHDYIIADFITDAAPPISNSSRWYWDGRRQVWQTAALNLASDAGAENIYAFDNGDVVLATEVCVAYINPDGTYRWFFEPPIGSSWGPGGPTVLSGNEDWIQVKNLSVVSKVDGTTPVVPDTEVQATNTAGLDARDWVCKHRDFGNCAVSLSRQGFSSGGQPICIVHRAREHDTNIRNGDFVGTPDPYSETNWRYTSNCYATEETLNRQWDSGSGGFSPTIGDHRMMTWDGGRGFDCAPGCTCGCGLPAFIGY